MADDYRPERVGATAASVELGDRPATVQFPIAAPAGPAASLRAPEIYLNINNVKSDHLSAGYRVYMNLPANADPRGHSDRLVGQISPFGIVQASRPSGQHAGDGLHFALEATEVIDRLKAVGDWDGKTVRVTFVPRRAASVQGTIEVGEVSLYYA